MLEERQKENHTINFEGAEFFTEHRRDTFSLEFNICGFMKCYFGEILAKDEWKYNRTINRIMGSKGNGIGFPA